MKQALLKKLDNGNRLLIPNSFLRQLGIEKNATVLVSMDSEEECIKITKIKLDIQKSNSMCKFE